MESIDSKDIKLVIARYQEDLGWLDKLNPKYNTLVYNKGPDLSRHSLNNVIRLPNVGRESHTWLYHIFHQYELLDKHTIFLQGRIDDLGCMVYHNPSFYIPKLLKYGYSVSRLGLLGPLHWQDNVGIEFDPRYKKSWEFGLISRNKYGFRRFAKSFLPEIPIFVATSYGGCFAVSRELIWTKPRSFYKDLLLTLSHHTNPIEGHYIERLWCYIFTQNYLLSNALIDVCKTKIERNFTFRSKSGMS